MGQGVARTSRDGATVSIGLRQQTDPSPPPERGVPFARRAHRRHAHPRQPSASTSTQVKQRTRQREGSGDLLANGGPSRPLPNHHWHFPSIPIWAHTPYMTRWRIRPVVWAGELAAVVLAGCSGSSHASRASSPSTASSACPVSFVLPFVPRYLPTGWQPVGRHVAHAQRETGAIEVWAGTDKATSVYGIIEVWRGADLPIPAPSTTITVLRHPAQFGPISDGSSVLFRVGDPANACDHWALVAHPGTTPEILRTVADHLAPVHP
jgi:hypothetical protein